MRCPRCGLQAYRSDDRMCYACGFTPFNQDALAAAVLMGMALAAVFGHYLLPHVTR